MGVGFIQLITPGYEYNIFNSFIVPGMFNLCCLTKINCVFYIQDENLYNVL